MQKGLVIFLGACLASVTVSRADTFVINPLQSILTISAVFQGASATPQPPSGFTAAYSGTINATTTPMSIQFNDAAASAAVSGTYSPAVGGGAGTAPGNYGGNFTVAGIFPGTFAIRGLIASLTSNALTLTDGNFDASQLLFVVNTGSVDYRVAAVAAMGNVSLINDSGTNGAGTGSIGLVGGVQTLTIPIDVTIMFTVVNPDDATFHLAGNIVATAVPEPTSWKLFGLGAVAMGAPWLRRKN